MRVNGGMQMLQAWVSCMEDFGSHFAKRNMAGTKGPVLLVSTSMGHLGQSRLETET